MNVEGARYNTATTDKEVLQALQRGEKLGNDLLEVLWQRGLINVRDVTNMQTPKGQRELLFISFTDGGRKLIEGRI
jgi:hypothetical protein